MMIWKKITHPNYFFKFHDQFCWNKDKNTKNQIFSLYIFDSYLNPLLILPFNTHFH
jgi:hypothetical protein